MKPIPKTNNLPDPGNSSDSKSIPDLGTQESAIRQDGLNSDGGVTHKRAKGPNDPKLSDGRGWRDRCVAGERRRQDEVDPENWTGRIVNPNSAQRSPCQKNVVSIVPI